MTKASTKVGHWDPAGEGNGELDDDLSWLNEKSRDELTDLLVKADVLIKERESGMSPQQDFSPFVDITTKFIHFHRTYPHICGV